MIRPPTLADWNALSHEARAAWLAAQSDPDATLVSLGDACEQLARSKVADAIETGQELLTFATPAGRSRPRLLRALTTAFAYAGRVEESLAASDEAIRIASQNGFPIEAARAAVASLHPLTKLGRVEQALDRGERSRAALLELGEVKLAARADINLGNIRKSIGDIEGAAVHLSRARESLSDEPAMVAHVENTLGETQWLRDDFAGARVSFEAAASHFRQTEQTFASAVVEGNLADVAAREGRLQDALAHFESARRVFEKDVAKSHLARITAEEAEVLEALGAPNEALRALDGSLPWLDANGFAAESARGRLARSRVLAAVGRVAEAEADADLTTVAARARGDVTLLRRASLLKAELALGRNDAQTAATAATSVLADPACPPLDRIKGQHHLARALAALGDVAQARSTLDSAILECRELDIGALLADLLVARASLQENTASRVSDLSEAVDLVERLRSSLRADRLRAQWTGSRIRAYEALALARLAQATPDALDAAFDAVERSKSRVLLDLVQRAADRAATTTKTADSGSLAEQYQLLRERLSALYSRWESDGPVGERRGQQLPSDATRAAMREGEHRLEQLSRRLAAERGPASLMAVPATSAHIRRGLAPTECIVEYFIADQEVLAFVVTRGGIAVRRALASAAEVSELATHVLFQMRRATRLSARSADGLLDAVRVPLTRLYDLLLRPLEELLHGMQTLAVVPHGALHGVPFHALRDERTAAYVVERWNVRTAPSATLAVLRGARSDAAPRDALIVGVADERAPAIAAEAESIADIWPNATVLLGEDATADAVLAQCSNHRIIHLACHGRFALAMPHASGLRFRDRWASVREILDIPLRTDLVVLAGCETGRTALEPGDEAVGLPRAFLAAGATSVLVSLWPVRDDAARSFMIDLHERFLAREGRSLASLVRETMLARMTEQPHPAFWGAFGLAGADPWATIASAASALRSSTSKGKFL